VTTPVSGDLNQVIVSAVQARIEAEVAAALSGDEMIGKYVAAALNQPIEVGRDSYSRGRRTTYLRETIDTAMREATKAVVTQVIAEEREAIERAVRAELRDRVDGLAVQLVNSAVESVEKPYGLSVTLQYPRRD
jgi:hypothetical protein